MRKIIIAVIGIIFIGAICFVGFKNSETGVSADTVLNATEESGWISEKMIGDTDVAKVVIFEYADFGCGHCAEQNKVINELVRKYNGEVAVVFRSYDLGFQNGAVAARAATAAQIQGYFEEYKNLLFDNQVEWLYESGDKLDGLWTSYFEQASGGDGDVDKFREDMKSDAVKKRLEFEQKLGKEVNLRGTPLFRINGENVSSSELAEEVEEIIGQLNI